MGKTREANGLLRYQRKVRNWTQEQAAEALLAICGPRPRGEVNAKMISRWERGEQIPGYYYREKLCELYAVESLEELGLVTRQERPEHTEDQDVDRRQANQTIAGLVGGLLVPSSLGIDPSFVTELWPDDLLITYADGIAACQELYSRGSPQQVEALLPLYCTQIARLAQQSSPVQQAAAKLASQAYQLACRLAMHREDFGIAQQAGQQALLYAQRASDLNLQVASLIRLAELGSHRKLSAVALQAYEDAVSLLHEQVTPLLKGRTYAGIAEVYAMRGQRQEALRTMGLAYEHYPLKPKEDPAYPYLHATRYSLYMFGDAQSRLLLGQPKEAERAVITLKREITGTPMAPITKLNLMCYQVEVRRQQGELESTSTILTKAALLAKDLGSRLFFNKLVTTYQKLQTQWPREAAVVALQEVFQPW